MKVFTSPFQNPFINLALEDHFLRERSDLPLLFFYVNRPCVVLGRFQNPWIECQLPFLSENGIWLVRRQSGGGCVYHDEGNLNFSFITPESRMDRNKHAELLREAFQARGIELRISPRHDLWLEDGAGEWKKISGSAYKQTKDSSFHHGTFLVNSDLGKLATCLEQTLVTRESKSIPSVRSKVISLSQRYPEFTIEEVRSLIADYLRATPVTLDGSYLSLPEVQESFQRLNSWEWIWGETPAFEVETLKGPLTVHKGLIAGTRERFCRENVSGIFSESELDRIFPDFSEQHRSSNQIL